MTDREQQGVPLPEPAEFLFGDCFTADQLLTYGNARAAAARREALEEAAKVCEHCENLKTMLK